MPKSSTSEQYYTNARRELHELEKVLDQLSAVAVAPALEEENARKLGRDIKKAGDAIDQLLATIAILEATSLDVVDLQGRMRNEVKDLVNPLKRVDKLAATGAARSGALKQGLVALEAQAQYTAGAIFPSSIQGLKEINDLILMRLRPKVLGNFKREVQNQKDKGKWTAARTTAVERASEEVETAFHGLNEFLNLLATTHVDEDTLRDEIRSHRAAMAAVVARARALKKDQAFSGFRGILDEVRDIATTARKRLLELEVPLFPAWKDLGPVKGLIEKGLYDGLAGAQKFALLNITARMQSVTLDVDGTKIDLLDPSYKIGIWLVFPDRLYLKAKTALIGTVSAHTEDFGDAPAGLHRFNAGSYKQKRETRGGLQLSFAPKLEDAGANLNVDADIDLFKRPLSHLFGEVLVNHLTGDTTSQYKVHEILRKQQVPQIGGFRVVSTSTFA